MLSAINSDSKNAAAATHRNCFVCADRKGNSSGLAIDFLPDGTDKVIAQFEVEEQHQGYAGLLHGGIASTLLDGAMTHCLLQQNIPALTAELSVRYHQPIKLGAVITIYAELLQRKRGIFVLVARLVIDDEVLVSARGKFLLPR